MKSTCDFCYKLTLTLEVQCNTKQQNIAFVSRAIIAGACGNLFQIGSDDRQLI